MFCVAGVNNLQMQCDTNQVTALELDPSRIIDILLFLAEIRLPFRVTKNLINYNISVILC
jgi:hypothetical protein